MNMNEQRGKEAVQQYNVFNHIAYLTKDQAEQILVKYPDCYSQAASIAENFGILPQQVISVFSRLLIDYTSSFKENKEIFIVNKYSSISESELG